MGLMNHYAWQEYFLVILLCVIVFGSHVQKLKGFNDLTVYQSVLHVNQNVNALWDSNRRSAWMFCSPVPWILDKAVHHYIVITVKANVHVSGLACADDFVILRCISIEISTGAINRHAATYDIRIHAHQFQAVLFVRDSLTDVNKCMYSGIRRSSQTDLSCNSAFFRLSFHLLTRCVYKGRGLPGGCTTWPAKRSWRPLIMTASTGCLTRGTENHAIRVNAALPLTLNYADTARAKRAPLVVLEPIPTVN